MNKKTVAFLLFLTAIAILAVITFLRFAENLGESYRTFGSTITGSSHPIADSRYIPGTPLGDDNPQ